MAIINDVLDVARIEAGQLELDSRDFDVHDDDRAGLRAWPASTRPPRAWR